MKVTKPGNKRKRGAQKEDDDGSEVKDEVAADETKSQERNASENGNESGGPEKRLKAEVPSEA